MTLAMHGKSRRRQGALVLAALLAVMGAILTGATLRPAGEAHAAPGDFHLQICKEYQVTGLVDQFARPFDFTMEVLDEQTGTSEQTVPFQLTVSEGGTSCTDELTFPFGKVLEITEAPLAGWDQHY